MAKKRNRGGGRRDPKRIAQLSMSRQALIFEAQWEQRELQRWIDYKKRGGEGEAGTAIIEYARRYNAVL